MKIIPVDTSAALITLCSLRREVVAPWGEVATDSATGAALFRAELIFIHHDQADVISVTVPEIGLGRGLTSGSIVTVADLTATLTDGCTARHSYRELTFRASRVSAT